MDIDRIPIECGIVRRYLTGENSDGQASNSLALGSSMNCCGSRREVGKVLAHHHSSAADHHGPYLTPITVPRSDFTELVGNALRDRRDYCEHCARRSVTSRSTEPAAD